MEFRPGKLYRCTGHYLLVCASKEALRLAGSMTVVPAGPASKADGAKGAWPAKERWAQHLSKKIGAPVLYVAPGDIFMFLEHDGHYHRVLFGEFAGWFSHNIWLEFKEA